jgi:RNA polymerase sigma-70 factor (ECF subfamily)
MGDLTYAEAAQVLSCPVGTVRSRLSRGRKLLQKQLSGYLG